MAGDQNEARRLEDHGREFAFFRDALGLIDQVEDRQGGAQLKPAFLTCIQQRNNADGILYRWDQIPLETETGEKLVRGFKGYANALAVVMRRLRWYAYNKDANVVREARRLLGESRLILEYREGYTERTGYKINKGHRYVIELWKYL